MYASGMVAVGNTLAAMLLIDGTAGLLILIAVMLLGVAALFGFLNYSWAKLSYDSHPGDKTAWYTPFPDPTGLRWIVAGSWTLLEALMWVIILYGTVYCWPTWLFTGALVAILVAMSIVDIIVNVRLGRAAGRRIGIWVLGHFFIDLASTIFLLAF